MFGTTFLSETKAVHFAKIKAYTTINLPFGGLTVPALNLVEYIVQLENIFIEKFNKLALADSIGTNIKTLLNNRDWDQFLHLFLLAYRSSVHETTGQTHGSIVMGYELRLPCDLKFGCTPGDDVAGEDYVSTLRQRMDDIHERVRSSIQGASDRMKKTYGINANDGRYQPGNHVWLYNPQRSRPYEVETRINDVVYWIQKLPRGKPRVVHFNRLAPFAGSNDEQAEARVRQVDKSVRQTAPANFCLAHCVAADLRMSRGIAFIIKKAFRQFEELRRQRPEVGRVLQITVVQQEKERSVFYLVTKKDVKPTLDF
ncbi:hypothetical protein NQ318_019464 [Aromia moschata]|uniref:Integrase p58-like C-terminal domain-containing protein n=1 Tax=Aromia moschata TaxID=1265417 RepID=A0AAV8YBN2_9CUCU|nr:hypothetical protein NQ318_019464 [Aromia moschata]